MSYIGVGGAHVANKVKLNDMTRPELDFAFAIDWCDKVYAIVLSHSGHIHRERLPHDR